MPIDGFGREINYLRVSITDRCNLRCVYCMPLDGLTFLPAEDLLTAAEIELVVKAAASVGFRKVRLTGGEPTLRADLVDIVERISHIDGIREVALTTNGVLLPSLADPLKRAGLARANIHIDALQPERLRRIMRLGELEPIWAGVMAAEEAGLTPIKLNAVVARGYNDEDVVDLAALTIDRPWHVRFIEMMPLAGGECACTSVSRLVTSAETRDRIERSLGPLEPLCSADAADESRNYRLIGAAGVIGFISPVSEPYCGSCNRMRLTADGRFHLCLLNDDEVDIRDLLRPGNGRVPESRIIASVSDALVAAVRRKPTGHRLEQGVTTRHRAMFQIGG